MVAPATRPAGVSMRAKYQRRCAQLEVRVVGEQRLAAGGVRAGQHPVVRATPSMPDSARRPAPAPELTVVDLERAEQRRIVGRDQRLLARVGRQRLVDARYGQAQPRRMRCSSVLQLPPRSQPSRSAGQGCPASPGLGLQAGNRNSGEPRAVVAHEAVDNPRRQASSSSRVRSSNRAHCAAIPFAPARAEAVGLRRQFAEGLGETGPSRCAGASRAARGGPAACRSRARRRRRAGCRHGAQDAVGIARSTHPLRQPARPASAPSVPQQH